MKHSSRILNLARGFASRESAFILAVVGVIVQSFHTYFITFSLSSYTGFLKIFQALLMALFLSGALLYFTLKTSDDNTKKAKRYRTLVMTFAILETVINLWYWGHKLLIELWPNPDYGAFIICIPFSIFLPFILKSYSTEVRVDDFSEEPSIDKGLENLDKGLEKLKAMSDEERTKMFNDFNEKWEMKQNKPLTDEDLNSTDGLLFHPKFEQPEEITNDVVSYTNHNEEDTSIVDTLITNDSNINDEITEMNNDPHHIQESLTTPVINSTTDANEMFISTQHEYEFIIKDTESSVDTNTIDTTEIEKVIESKNMIDANIYHTSNTYTQPLTNTTTIDIEKELLDYERGQVDTEVAIVDTNTIDTNTIDSVTQVDTEVAIVDTNTIDTNTIDNVTQVDTEVAIVDTNKLSPIAQVTENGVRKGVLSYFKDVITKPTDGGEIFNYPK